MEIIAYTTPGCFYCDKLKELFQRAQVDSTIITIGTDVTREEFKESFPDVQSFPHVIIDGETIGGLVETAKLFLQKDLVSSTKK
mgnify:CR=1 FL=1|tara:strand:+ start:164 stop:415 length:252 start_codon:yes stop_codon:yes gene_type:complete